jgi:hypothetical protein
LGKPRKPKSEFTYTKSGKFLSRSRPVSKDVQDEFRISHERYEDDVIKIVLRDSSFLEAWRKSDKKFKIERISIGKNTTESATILMKRLLKSLEVRSMECEINPNIIHGKFLKNVMKFLTKFGFEKGEDDIYIRKT